jgi:uncharacterized protein
MRILLCALVICFVTIITNAQQSKMEFTYPPSASDSKANSDTVPEVYAMTTQFDSILVLRFKYQADLLVELERFVKYYKIRNAVILSGIGSVRNYHYHMVSNRTFPSKNIFVKDTTAPADIVSMNGYVVDGRVHAHITFADTEKSFGGHLEPGTHVFAYAAVTLGVVKGEAIFNRMDDKTYR